MPGRSLDVRNAKAFVEQDRVNIMETIADKVEVVNNVVNTALAKVLAHRVLNVILNETEFGIGDPD